MTIELENIVNMPEVEFAPLYAAFLAECAKRTGATPGDPIRVNLCVGAYNARRYGRPWIAKVSSWPVGGRPEIEWGRYCGDDSGGELEILARPGDIVRSGQKDNRGNGGDNSWNVVLADGTLNEIDQAEARKLYGGAK